MKKSPFKNGDTVTLTFRRKDRKASSRTRNRIREHGPQFVVRQSPRAFRGSGELESRLCVMLEPIPNPTEWAGWLPLDEIEIINAV
jgi:hypothetical protein